MAEGSIREGDSIEGTPRAVKRQHSSLMGSPTNAAAVTVSPTKISSPDRFSAGGRMLSQRSSMYGTTPIYFNPIRFLAMGLIKKNQDRKELDRQKDFAEFNLA